MSNATYNGQWAGAMAELAEQVHLEDPILEAEEGAPEPEPVRPTSIAHELGALLINISPAKVKGKFGENKKAPAILPHLICKVATDPAFSPVIVYMDDAHEYMVGKKFDKTGPGRFCKELQNYKKSFFTRKKNGGFFTPKPGKPPQPCPPDDKNCPNGTFDARILFIGCTSQPELADPKQTKLFFDRMLYFPYPDHASRYMLWRPSAFSDGGRHPRIVNKYYVLPAVHLVDRRVQRRSCGGARAP